jgi:hypothetical protein
LEKFHSPSYTYIKDLGTIGKIPGVDRAATTVIHLQHLRGNFQLR